MPSRASNKESSPLKSLYTKLRGQQTSVNNLCKCFDSFSQGSTASKIEVSCEENLALSTEEGISFSDDPIDLQPLTPWYFLTFGHLLALPELYYSNAKLNQPNRWQMVQRQVQDIWPPWRTEYLSQLQARSENWKPAIQLDVGRLVIIVDTNLPTMKWKLGRIST